MQVPELGSRFDADLLDERGARLTVGLQRLGLPSRAVEHEHPLRVEPLAQRLLRREHVELADDLAMPSRRYVALDRQLERRQAQLLQVADLSTRERLVRDVGQRCAAPERQRLARVAIGDQRLEATRVEVARRSS